MATTLPVHAKQNMSLLRSWKLWAELGLLALLCVSQYLSISIVNLALTGCILLIMFTMDRIEECTVLLFMAMPMFNLLNYRIGNVSMYYLIVLIFWLRYFEQYNWSISREKLLILLLFLILRLTALPEVKDVATWFLLFSVVVLTYREDFLMDNLTHIIFFLTLSFLLSSQTGYLMLQAGSSIYTQGYVWSEEGVTIRFAGLIGDPVFYSQFCALLVAANLAISCYRPKYFWVGFLGSVALAAFCVLSYAKTGTALVIVLFLVMLLWQIRRKSSSRKTFWISLFLVFSGIAVLAGGILYILSDPDNAVVQAFLIRLDTKDLLTGRGEFWPYYISMLTDNWKHLLLPVRESLRTTPYIRLNGGVISHVHNIYLETACLFGIIPAMLMLLWVFAGIWEALRQRRGILMLMPMGVLLASGFSLHGHTDFHYYTLLTLTLAFANQDRTRL